MECIGNQISCPPATSDIALHPSSAVRPLPSAKNGNEGCVGQSLPGILRMWRRPGMLGATTVVVVVVAVFPTAPYLSISSRFIKIPRSRRPSGGASNWVDCLNGEEESRAVYAEIAMSSAIGTLSVRSL